MELYLAEAVAYQVVCPERLHGELLEHNDGVKKLGVHNKLAFAR